MAEFVGGNSLNSKLESIIKNADEYLILISPYIKLHDRIKDQLKLKRTCPGLQITVLFGKAEKGTNRITVEDVEFLKSLPNIEIRYEKNLHAKYYASEDGALITSLNLYDFSQNNNIEAGVYMQTPGNIMGITGWSKDAELDGNAYNFFCDVIDNSDLLFRKVPTAEPSFLGKTKYSEPVIEVDDLENFFNSKEKYTPRYPAKNAGVNRAGQVKIPASQVIPAVANVRVSTPGFCIRTGKPIPFDLHMPYCKDAFSSWSRFKNEEYPEKYCHYSGEATKGETCFKRPVLNKYWKQSRQRD